MSLKLVNYPDVFFNRAVKESITFEYILSNVLVK